MPILITGAGSTLDKIAGDMLTARAGQAQRTQALAALRDANPTLEEKVPQGTAVVIPEVPHLRVDLTELGAVAGAPRLDAVDAPLAPVKEIVENRANLVVERANGIIDDLANLAATPPDPILKKRLTKGRVKDITNRAREDSSSAATLAQSIAAALPRWQKQIDELKTKLFRVS